MIWKCTHRLSSYQVKANDEAKADSNEICSVSKSEVTTKDQGRRRVRTLLRLRRYTVKATMEG
jgi:hypothetical protein